MAKPANPLIWDLPTRLFHWALVACIVGSWVTAEVLDDAMDVHLYLGYTCLTLLLFRLVWGFVGPRHARFSSFVRGPSRVLAYARAVRSGTAAPSAGHNPLGAVSVVAMLLALLAQVALGLFASDDFFYAGPYNALLSESGSDTATHWHELGFDVITVLVVIHVCAILWYRVRRQENLVLPMITGRKPADTTPSDFAIAHSHLGRAAVVLAACAGLVWALVQLAPPPVDPFAF